MAVFFAFATDLVSQSGLNVDKKSKFRQTIEIGPGQEFVPKALPLPNRKSLDFTVPTLPADAVLAPAEARKAREYIVQRINAASAVVKQCVEEKGPNHKATSEIIQRLQKAAANATGDLARDLNNLLIAGLASVDIEGDADWNPTPKSKFKLWSFRKLDDTDALCGPTIEAHPNSTLLIPVLNLLDRRDLELCGFPVQDPIRTGPEGDPVNLPHGFDIINLHTHGLNVSPSWPADDVFREIYPFQLKFFVYHIPKDHPIGTFWYHPHKHGAVGPHVSGGMAGALLVKGESGTPLGLDKIGNDKGWHEQEPLILQQLRPYQTQTSTDCQVASTDLVFRPDFFSLRTLIDLPNVTKVDGIGRLATWMQTNLRNPQPAVRTFVSGHPNPGLDNRREGETCRFRLIHAGIDGNWTFSIRKQKENLEETPRIQVIAWDGIPLADPYELAADHPLTLSPGNRADILVYFAPGSAGTYGVYDHDEKTDETIKIAELPVLPGNTDKAKFLSNQDVAVAQILKSQPIFNGGPEVSFKVDLKNRKGIQEVPPNSGKFIVYPGDGPSGYQLNGKLFPGDPITFDLNRTARVTITANGHPIHIHVNPLFLEPSEDRRGLGLPTTSYWTDTLFVAQGSVSGTMPFENWTGKTVVHCHILDHEDNGMMNIFEIRNPVGAPIAPLPGVFDLTSLPSSVLQTIHAVWPPERQTEIQIQGKPTVFAFLPRAANKDECSHCIGAMNGIIKLRGDKKASPDFNIVVIIGPNTDGVSQLADKLNLDRAKDVICADPKLIAFQGLGLIDGNPIYNKETHMYTFPDSFDSDGSIIHFTDIMHGLFILDPHGFIASSTRTFLPLDDPQQLLSRLQFAQNVPKGLDTLEKSLGPSSTGSKKGTGAAGFLNLKRQISRYQEFKQMSK